MFIKEVGAKFFMSFAEEIRKSKGSELSDRERNDILKKEASANKENDILKVSNTLIQMIKDSFKKRTPEEEYKENFFGTRVYNGKKILRADLCIHSVVYNHAGRIRFEAINDEEYITNVIYADKASIKTIKNNVKTWLNKNDIIIDNISTLSRNGFAYDLKIYL